MPDFIPGQRWISDTEAELGLGTVLRSDVRTVTVFFDAGGATRTYARHNAPLSRVRFTPGDTVESHHGWNFKVENVEEREGLIFYRGTRLDEKSPAELPEMELSNFIQFSKPGDRLLAGQVDPAQWFSLRYETLAKTHQIMQAPVRGLCGGRVDLIPHQFYIAWEVATRYAPRVLLADEVGLGKTIEAGLIIHQQLLSGRASRVLVVVPETLMHQWLVEMLRRFNLRFSIFDEARLEEDIPFTGTGPNPFHEEQLVLCSLNFLVDSAEWLEAVEAGEWDLLVVDEAQHLVWRENYISPEYQMVEDIAAGVAGVLLLTATPEQLGKAGHFARLRLLDPERFYSYAHFLEEEELYEPVAEAVQYLLDDQPLPPRAVAHLEEALGEADNRRLLELLNQPRKRGKQHTERLLQAKAQLLEDLLDRHGTGRVLFRNTRAAIGGFPQRRVHLYPQQLPGQYQACLQHLLPDSGGGGGTFLLNPELCYRSVLKETRQAGEDVPGLGPEQGSMHKMPEWWHFDPRILWLLEKAAALRPEKILVICAHANLAMDIDQALRGAGIPSTVFHEELSLVARDRAAAYFADQEEGARVLVCSEIGSEGRNFQFARHLVLFDLPLNPDLLEQRIGRLDRIGQQHTIEIHVPYLEHSPQAVLVRWYQEGLNAFEHTCPAGHDVYVQIRAQLLEALAKTVAGGADATAALDNLIELGRDLHEEFDRQLQRGRDRLLELHSCRKEPARQLCDAVREQDADATLQDYMERVFDVYGVNQEEHSANCLLVTPGENLLVPSFPELPEEGAVLTYDRAIASSREDVLFLSWEHPMVLGAMDLVLGGGLGNTALSAVRHPKIKAGSLLLEAVCVLECIAPRRLQANRFLPPTPFRIVVDKQGNDVSAALPYAELNAATRHVNKEVARQAIRSQTDFLREMIEDCETFAREQAKPLLQQSLTAMHQNMDAEIARLRALKQVNPNVRDSEIELLVKHRAELDSHLQAAQVRMDALRVLVGI